MYHPDLPENKKVFGDDNLEVYYSLKILYFLKVSSLDL